MLSGAKHLQRSERVKVEILRHARGGAQNDIVDMLVERALTLDYKCGWVRACPESIHEGYPATTRMSDIRLHAMDCLPLYYGITNFSPEFLSSEW